MEIWYSTTKIEKNILQHSENLCQSHNTHYIKLKKMVISKKEIWLWHRFWGCCKIFFWIFMVEYQISNLPWSESTFKLKFMACFLSVRSKLLVTVCVRSPCSTCISSQERSKLLPFTCLIFFLVFGRNVQSKKNFDFPYTVRQSTTYYIKSFSIDLYSTNRNI